MKKLLLLSLFFVSTNYIIAQDDNLKHEIIPDDLIGTWVIDMPGQGDVPSQIIKWIFLKKDTRNSECEFHWLFKRKEDKKFITVAVAVYDFNIIGNKIKGKMTKAGSQQKQAMVMEFYDEIKWYLPGDEFYEKFGNKEINSEYEIKENKLLFRNDHNGDGDFEDEGETEIYTKK